LANNDFINANFSGKYYLIAKNQSHYQLVNFSGPVSNLNKFMCFVTPAESVKHLLTGLDPHLGLSKIVISGRLLNPIPGYSEKHGPYLTGILADVSTITVNKRLFYPQR